MKVEVVRHGDKSAHVFLSVRSVMILGEKLVITTDDHQYDIYVSRIMTMFTENE